MVVLISLIFQSLKHLHSNLILQSLFRERSFCGKLTLTYFESFIVNKGESHHVSGYSAF